MALRRCACVLGLLWSLGGCEIVADFDRSKIPDDTGLPDGSLPADGAVPDAALPDDDAAVTEPPPDSGDLDGGDEDGG